MASYCIMLLRPWPVGTSSEAWVFVAIAALLLAPSCTENRSLEEETIRRFERTTLIGLCPEAARLHLEQFKSREVHLYRAYTQASGRRNARQSLAYLMLLDENETYISLVERNWRRLLENDEFQAWTFIFFEGHKGQPSEAYRARMESVLRRLDRPEVRFYFVRRKLMNSADSAAAGEMLGFLVNGPPGQAHGAFRCLSQIPPQQRAELLLPLLEDESPTGAYAAMFVARADAYRPRALAYLNRLRASQDTALGRLAERVLEALERSEQSQMWPEMQQE
jgi:hypothetical protein